MSKNDFISSAFRSLRTTLETYAPVSAATWLNFKDLCVPLELHKHEFFCTAGQVPRYFGFVYTGLLRVFTTDQKGNEYNKIFFTENSFPGSTVALLTSSPSRFTIQALETSSLLQIDYQAYRDLLLKCDDLKLFHIHYLEKNWVIEKEKREIALVQENATERYLRFLGEYPQIEQRLAQFHIASHLGVTPTQLSRIRKNFDPERSRKSTYVNDPCVVHG